MQEENTDHEVAFPTGVVGAVLAALCCVGIFTPLLVAALVALGLGALTRSLDLILASALAVFLIMAFLGWRARKTHAVQSTLK